MPFSSPFGDIPLLEEMPVVVSTWVCFVTTFFGFRYNGSFQDGPVVTVILISVSACHPSRPEPFSGSQFGPWLVLGIGEARQVHVIHLQLPEVSSAAYNADQKERKKKKTTLRKSRTVLDCCFPKFVLENEVTHAVWQYRICPFSETDCRLVLVHEM